VGLERAALVIPTASASGRVEPDEVEHLGASPMRAILFPGQGAQHVGMGREFFESSKAARSIFERADAALGIALSKLCFEGPAAELERTDVCQPAILVCSTAIVAALEERGALRRSDFAFAAGLSLGEYTALCFAGAIGFEDAVRLVRARGQGMQRASEDPPSGMVALLGASEEQARAVCAKHAQGEVLVAANFLGPGNVAISGTKTALARVAENAKADGIRRAIPLGVAGAFHSPLMKPGVATLEAAFAKVKLAAPAIPVVSNVTAQPHGAPDSIRATLLAQVTSPVLWEKSTRELLARGVTDFLEPGPGAVLTGLVRKVDANARCVNVQKPSDLAAANAGGAS
jgi:[acyl-carrier-protein] S-malonyltransferase